MRSHRLALRRLRAALGVRVAVRHDGGMWRVYEGLITHNHHRIAGSVIAWATTRRRAIELAAQPEGTAT